VDRRLDPESREKIYRCISDSPGLHFREIQRRLGAATGTLDYHLHLLHKQGSIRLEKDGKFTRYYTTNKTFDQEEKDMLNLLRNENLRHVLIFLIENKNASASNISEALNFSPSKLSNYLKSLLDMEIINQKKKGRFRHYSVKNAKNITKYLETHKSSFIDDIVDRFIDTWAD